MEQELRKIFQELFNGDFLEDDFLKLTMENSSFWDSLKQMELIIKLQKHFNIKLSFQDLEQLKSVQSILCFLSSKLASH